MQKFLINPCNIYILIWVSYSIQGTIIKTGGTIISQLLLLTGMFLGIYYTLKTLSIPRKTYFFKGLNTLFIMFIVYGVILMFSDHHYVIQAKAIDNEVSNSSYLKSILMSLPHIYSFYYFSYKGYLTKSLLRKWVIVFILVAIFRFFDYQLFIITSLDKSAEEITNNMGYLFVALIPAVALFQDKPILRYGILIFSLIFVVLGMKRGAILIAAMSVLYVLYYDSRYNRKKDRVTIALLSIFLIASMYFVISNVLQSSDYFAYRLESTLEGSTSSRDEIYSDFYNHFINEPNVIIQLFGNGANATLGIGDNYAHNDWLEIAINQGVLGLMLHLLYWLYFISIIKSANRNKEAKLVFTLTFMIFFLKSFFSMSYTGYSVTSCSIFCYYLATYNREYQRVST